MTHHDRNLSEQGYVTSLSYMPGYIRYQTPCLLSFAAAAHSKVVPDFRKPFRYIDLGCGPGVTLILLAASYPHAHFVGVDLNPEHIRDAEKLVQECDLKNIEFRCASFDECTWDDEDPFEYVAAHGIMSWVSEDVKTSLLQLVDRIIAPGGLLYFCHFVRPAAVKMETLFHLISECSNSEDPDIVARTRMALKEIGTYQDQGLPLFRRYPSLSEDLQELNSRDARYLAHEYANQHFTPEFFSQTVKRLSEIGCVYAGSPSLSRNSPKNLLSAAHGFALDGLDGAQAQIKASLLSHELFRWDIFQRRSETVQTGMKLEDFKIAATTYPYVFPREMTLVRRVVNFENELFQFAVDKVCSQQHDLSTLLSDGLDKGWSQDELRSVVFDACGAGLFQPVTLETNAPTARARTQYKLASKTSRVVWNRDFSAEGGTGHVSQILGGAITVNWFSGLFLGELDGQTPQDAVVSLRHKTKNMSDEEQQRYGFEKGFDDEAFAEKISKILNRELPYYVKYGILEPCD